MAEPRYTFPSVLESLVKGLGPLVTERTRQKLKAAGLDLDKLPPAIPSEDMPRYQRVIATDIWPEASEEEALRLLGVHFIRGWQKTLLGSAMSAFLKLVGPERALMRLDRAFRTADNYITAKTVLPGPKEALVTLNDTETVPMYWLGIFQGCIELMGLDGVATLHEQTLPGGTFRLVWK